MKINFKTLIDNDVIESGKVTELFNEGKSIWKGLSDDLYDLSESYEFIKFDHTKNNTFNEAAYKIVVKPLNEAKIEKKKSYEDQMEYGLPEDQKYPLYDKAHVLSAIKFFNYCKDPEKQAILAKAIIKKMKQYDISFDSIGGQNKLKEFLPVLKEEDESKKVEILNNLRKDMQGEFDAIIDYDERANVAKDAGYTELADTLEDIRDEEKVHVGELQTQLKKLDPEYEKGLIDGEKEVKEELSEATKPDKNNISNVSNDDEDEDLRTAKPISGKVYDDGDGMGKYILSDGGDKIYDFDENYIELPEGRLYLNELMTYATGKNKGKEITHTDGSHIKNAQDATTMLKTETGKPAVLEPSTKKIHLVGKYENNTLGRKVNIEDEENINGTRYIGKQVNPYIMKAAKMNKEEAEYAKKLKEETKRKQEEEFKRKSDEFAKSDLVNYNDIVPEYMKTKEWKDNNQDYDNTSNSNKK